jgi:hypothetical protein
LLYALCASANHNVSIAEPALMHILQVQSGGSFDVDYSVNWGPQDKVILAGQKERQGDFVFTAQETGEYRFCFNNEISTFTDKVVDFEIAVCSIQFLSTANMYFVMLHARP